jgi:hypothetical protein
MKKGILDNKNSSNQSLLFIRDLNCIDNKMSEKEKDAFYNKEESENKELNFLKNEAIKNLNKNNVFQLTVKT